MTLKQMIKSEYFRHRVEKALKYKKRGLPNFKISRLVDLPLEVIKELDERKIFNLEDLEVSKK